MMNNFLWGSATAAYQCEGGWKEGNKGLSNWDVFCHSEKNNINPVTGDVASDHYHRYEEDIKMLAEGNQNAYRFSIAWTRIIPNGTGKVNEEGVDYYNKVINTCIRYGVEPMVTLYHYDMPISLFDDGGWENRKIVDAFENYANVCFEKFGDRVKYWMTINEPSYDTLCSFGFGNYPPNIQDLSKRWKAMYHMLLASALAVKSYRDNQYKGVIGLVSDSYSIDIIEENQENITAKENADVFYNKFVNDICVNGIVPERFFELMQDQGEDLDYMLEEDLHVFKNGTVDFLGINAYSRIIVQAYDGNETVMVTNNTGDKKSKNRTAIRGWFEVIEDPNTTKNPWGMEIYPKSIYDLLVDLNKEYPEIPIYITENGVGYYDVVEDGEINDDYRIDYCQGFIDWMLKAKKEGCDVRGYLVWSTMDLYSWINGYDKRYGLVYVDFENNNIRIPKKSYYWYKELIGKRGSINE